MNRSSALSTKSMRSHRRKELSGLLDLLKLVRRCHLHTIYIDVFRGKGGSVPRIDGKRFPAAQQLVHIGRANCASFCPRSSSRCRNGRSQEEADNRYILVTVYAAARSVLSRSDYCEIGDSTQFGGLLLYPQDL